ncbi:MAG: serine hydrolase domain-containing protein [Gammaproteobacteria bacterium]|nr:serine hydrolase domain-containing protein [Gammaproteobacteria bacterium]
MGKDGQDREHREQHPDASTSAPASVGLSARRLRRIDDHLARYVDDGHLPGWQVLVARGGQMAHLQQYGRRDLEADAPVTEDTLFRIYSMTKPITSVALMTLYEQGLFQLDDPIERFIPELGELQVFDTGDASQFTTVPAERSVTIRDLLTHTAGFTYGFMHAHPVDALYREKGIGGVATSGTLAEMVSRLGETPLLCQPGSQWNYSVATDILGHLIERISGTPLDRFLATNLFEPLGMKDTGFHVNPAARDRFAACYERKGDGLRLQDAPSESSYLEPPSFLSGGGGLVSTSADYLRFCRMLLGNGMLDGKRILGRKTLALMAPEPPARGRRPDQHGPARVQRDPLRRHRLRPRLGRWCRIRPEAQVAGSAGELAWGGMASTAFWVDPAEDLAVIFMTQLIPSSAYPIRRELRVLVYQALDD